MDIEQYTQPQKENPMTKSANNPAPCIEFSTEPCRYHLNTGRKSIPLPPYIYFVFHRFPCVQFPARGIEFSREPAVAGWDPCTGVGTPKGYTDK